MDESDFTLLTLERRSEGKPVATHSLELEPREGSSFWDTLPGSLSLWCSLPVKAHWEGVKRNELWDSDLA